ncbi:MAG: antitoxin Xre/MbcA/ParS toxin-binding domain-containing protein [Thermoanaerobaculia bacterium]
MTIKAPEVAEILGGQATLKRQVRSVDDLRELVEAGLPIESLELAVRRVAMNPRAVVELTHEIVPRSTLKRIKKRLNARQSERLERLARMTALAEEAWEDPELAHEFLTSRQPQLGGARPVDLARSDLGTRQVEQLLSRIEYSLPT